MHAYWFLLTHVEEPLDDIAVLERGISSVVFQWPYLVGSACKSANKARKPYVQQIHPPTAA